MPHVCLGAAVSSPRPIVLELGAIDRMEVRRPAAGGEEGAARAAGGNAWRTVDLERVRRETRACGKARVGDLQHAPGRDYLLGVWRDELHVPFVHLYRLSRGAGR